MNATSIQQVQPPVEADAHAFYRALHAAHMEIEDAGSFARWFSDQDFFGVNVTGAPEITLEHIAAMASMSAELRFRLADFAEDAKAIDQAVADLVELRRAQQDVTT